MDGLANAFKNLTIGTTTQALKTSANVSKSVLKTTSSVTKGIATAAESAEYAGQTIKSASQILNSTAKIGSQTVNSLRSLSSRTQNKITEKTQKLKSNSEARLRAIDSNAYKTAKNNFEQQKILKKVEEDKLELEKKNLKLEKEKANLESKKIIIDQQLEIKKKEAQIKGNLTKAQTVIKNRQAQAQINRKSKSTNASLINQLKKDYIKQVNEECNLVIIAFKSLLIILCGSSVTGFYSYCYHNYYGRPIFTKIKNVEQKYNSYINHLKSLINNTFDSNQSKIIDYINNKIDITRILNGILISKINDKNKLI